MNYLNGKIGVVPTEQLGSIKRVLTAEERAWIYNNGAGRIFVPGKGFV